MAALEAEVHAGRGGVDHDGVLIGFVAGERRHRTVPVIASFLAVFPNLLNGHVLLVDLVDDGAAVFHRGHCRLIHVAGVAVVEDGDHTVALVGLFVDAEGRMLRIGPVEIGVHALDVRAVELVALGGHRRQERLLPGRAPSLRSAQNPLDFLVASDLDAGRLMAGRNDDRIVGRIVVDGVDMRPVASRAYAGDVAKFTVGLLLRELFGGERLAGFGRIDVEAHGTLVKRLDHVGAIRVENVEETPFVNHRAVLIDFDHDVTDGADALFIGAAKIG